MIEKIQFPEGEIPQTRPKALPPDVFYEWVMANIRHLNEAGRLKRILQSPRRRPVEAPFTL